MPVLNANICGVRLRNVYMHLCSAPTRQWKCCTKRLCYFSSHLHVFYYRSPPCLTGEHGQGTAAAPSFPPLPGHHSHSKGPASARRSPSRTSAGFPWSLCALAHHCLLPVEARLGSEGGRCPTAQSRQEHTCLGSMLSLVNSRSLWVHWKSVPGAWRSYTGMAPLCGGWASERISSAHARAPLPPQTSLPSTVQR